MKIEPFFYCKNGTNKKSFCQCQVGGIAEICSDCARNPLNSPFEINDITNWFMGYPSANGKRCENYIKCKKKEE